MESNLQSNTERFKEDIKWRLTSIYPSPYAETIKSASRRPTKPNPENAQKFTLQAQPVEGVNEAQVNAKDGRIKVDKTARWPHSVHGVVAFKFNGQKFWGTGVMIGPNVVLTAGHNLYRKKDKVYAESVQFLPGMDGCLLPFGLVEVEKYLVSPKYIEDEEGNEDYGIIFLKEPIGEQTGYFGLSCLNAEEIRKRKINVTGYPGDKVASKPENIYEMWGMEGEASYINEDSGEMGYLIDTGTGQSGSGVWYQEGDNYYVCGVHSRGTNFVNIATLLTRAVYQQIHTWLQSQQVSFRELFLKLGNREGKLKFFGKKINLECVSLLMKYHLDEMTELSFQGREIGIEEVRMLAQNTTWANLLKLSLHADLMGSEGVRALTQNTSWTNLSELVLSECSIDSEGIRVLAQNTTWTTLSRLNLSCNNIGSEGAQALALNTSWTNLSELDLSACDIGSEGIRVLAQNTIWTNLSKFDCSFNNIDSEGARELAQTTSWTNLSVLILNHNEIGSEGAQVLAQNTSWTNLSKLGLEKNLIDSEGARVLAQNISWTSLLELDLSQNLIGSGGARGLAQNTSWTSLSKLALCSCEIGSEGVRGLAQNTSWTSLSKLDLRWNNIDSGGVRGLVQNTSWTNLSDLELSWNDIGPEGARALAQNTSWTNLSKLHLGWNKIDLKAASVFTQNPSWTSSSPLVFSYNKLGLEGGEVLKQNEHLQHPFILVSVKFK